MNYAILYFICYFAEALILWQYASNLFVSRHSRITRTAALGFLYTISFSLSLLRVSWINAVLFIVASFFFLLTQTTVKWFTALFHSVLLTSVMAMSELIAYGLISYSKPHFRENETYFPYLILHGILARTLYFAIVYLLILWQKNSQKNGREQDKSVFWLTGLPLTSVFVILTLINIDDSATIPSTSEWMIVLSAILLLGSDLLMFGINHYNQQRNLAYTEMQLLLQKEKDTAEYYKGLLYQNESQNILIHDIKKHLQSIALLNEQGAQKQLSAYVKQLNLLPELTNTFRLSDRDLLNFILVRYKRQFEKNHIAFYSDIRKGSTNFITDSDITSLFCNLLDNARNAAADCPDAYVEVTASRRDESSFSVITVINSCSTDPFSDPVNRLLMEGKVPVIPILEIDSIEKEKHGFGLKSIRRIVAKYQGNIKLYYDKDTSTFHAIVTMYDSMSVS